LSAVDIAQLAHAADKCILCHEGWRHALPNFVNFSRLIILEKLIDYRGLIN